MIDDRVPAAEATVWTMLFSWMVESRNARSTAMEMTAAGIEEAKVSPAFSPKATLAAVNTTQISAPRIIPRTVSSTRDIGAVSSEVVSGASPGGGRRDRAATCTAAGVAGKEGHTLFSLGRVLGPCAGWKRVCVPLFPLFLFSATARRGRTKSELLLPGRR